jgi:polyhydroxyalkanoate synthase
VAVCGKQLPPGRIARRIRPPLLERRQHQPAGPDVLLLPAQHLPVDLGRVSLPVFVLATREDHIVPWRSAYRTLGLLGGADKTFVLGASGHVAGVVNPPAKNRRSYWTAGPGAAAGPDAWLEDATERKGSWWPLWSQWLAGHGGGARPAPEAPGSVQYRAIEPAPGRYVKHRIH